MSADATSIATEPTRIEPHVKRIAMVVIAGAIMSVLDTTIVNVALHDLSHHLHSSLAGIQWVITGYLLSLAAVIPVTGWAVRRYSARRLYLVALFVLHDRRVAHPLLDLSLFRNRAFSAASLTTFCLGAALFGAMILMPLYFQVARGEDAIHTGLLLIPQGIGGGLGMSLSGRFTERIGAGRTSLIGGVILAVATLPFALIGAAMFVRGLGVGLSIMPAMTAAFSVLTPEQVNDASPQLTVLQRVGGSLGTAIVAVVLEGQLKHAQTQAAIAAGFAHAYSWVMAVTLLALLPTVLLARIERHARERRSSVPVRSGTPVLEPA